MKSNIVENKFIYNNNVTFELNLINNFRVMYIIMSILSFLQTYVIKVIIVHPIFRSIENNIQPSPQ